MEKNNIHNSVIFAICMIAFFIMLSAKSFGFSDMSWWWVVSPFLFFYGFVGLMIIFTLMIVLITIIRKKR